MLMIPVEEVVQLFECRQCRDLSLYSPLGESRERRLAERGPFPDATASDPPARSGRVIVFANCTTSEGET